MKRLSETAGGAVRPGKRLPDLLPLRTLVGRDFAILGPPERRPSGHRAGEDYWILDVWTNGLFARYSVDSAPVMQQLAPVAAGDYPIWCHLIREGTGHGTNERFRLEDGRGEPPDLTRPSEPRTKVELWQWCKANGLGPEAVKPILDAMIVRPGQQPDWHDIYLQLRDRLAREAVTATGS